MCDITLFFANESFFSQKAHLYLKEKGVYFNESVMNLQGGATLEPIFLKLNPNGEVPVLQHGDQYIPDSEKIMLYGEENFDGNILLPSEQKEEIMKLHNMLHSVPVEILTYGAVIYPDLVEDCQIPNFMKAKMKDNIMGDRMNDVIKKRVATASPEIIETYQRKLEMQKIKKEILADRRKIEETLDALEKVLDTVEEHLTAMHKELGTTDPIFLFGRKMTIADIDLSVLLARLRFIGLEKKFFPKPLPLMNQCYSGDSSQFCNDIPRPALRLYLDSFDQRESFKEVVLTPYMPKSMMKAFFRNKLKDRNTWLLASGLVLISALVFYHLRRK